jgi:hypothetical protein
MLGRVHVIKMEYILAHTVIKSKEIRYMGHAVHMQYIKEK